MTSKSNNFERKIIKTLLAVAVVATISTGTIANDKVPKQKPKIVSKDLQQHQQKVEKIKRTKEGQETFRLIEYYARAYNVDHRLVKAVVLAESGFDHKAHSSAGAKGLMQLMPVHKNKVAGCNDLYNKRCNIEIGVKHIKGLSTKYNGDLTKTLSAYNIGGSAVDKSLKKTGQIPKCTRSYVKKVQSYKEIF